MLQQYPDTFISVFVHTSGYTSVWGSTRASFYHVSGVPDAWFDGDRNCHGAYTNVQQMFQWYSNTYQLCMAEPTDVWVELEAFKVADNRVKLIALIGVDAGGAARDVKVHAVQLLDHYPSTPSWCRDTVKQGQDLGEISISPGNPVELTHEFTLDANSMAQPDDVKIVVFAQVPASSGPARFTTRTSSRARSVSARATWTVTAWSISPISIRSCWP
jgi:hypothetical protein